MCLWCFFGRGCCWWWGFGICVWGGVGIGCVGVFGGFLGGLLFFVFFGFLLVFDVFLFFGDFVLGFEDVGVDGVVCW